MTYHGAEDKVIYIRRHRSFSFYLSEMGTEVVYFKMIIYEKQTGVGESIALGRTLECYFCISSER